MELLEGPDLFDYLAARSCKLKEMEAICLVRRGRVPNVSVLTGVVVCLRVG